MSFLFSLPMVFIVGIGMLLSCRDLYFLAKKRYNAAKAGKIAFIFGVVSAGLIAAPHFFTVGVLGYAQYLLAGLYLLFLVNGALHAWRWFRLIRAAEDGNPNNDPVIPGEDKAGGKGDCGCPGKKDTGGSEPPAASPGGEPK